MHSFLLATLSQAPNIVRGSCASHSLHVDYRAQREAPGASGISGDRKGSDG